MALSATSIILQDGRSRLVKNKANIYRLYVSRQDEFGNEYWSEEEHDAWRILCEMVEAGERALARMQSDGARYRRHGDGK